MGTGAYLGRTVHTWLDKICNCHLAKVSNGPTEALNNLIKRINRIGFGWRTSRTTEYEPCATPEGRTDVSWARSWSDGPSLKPGLGQVDVRSVNHVCAGTSTAPGTTSGRSNPSWAGAPGSHSCQKPGGAAPSLGPTPSIRRGALHFQPGVRLACSSQSRSSGRCASSRVVTLT